MRLHAHWNKRNGPAYLPVPGPNASLPATPATRG
jgi:hypothetical protein